MKTKILLPLIMLFAAVTFYSCESNDTVAPQGALVQSTNKVLVEIFTNTSCIPCVAANQYLDAVTDTNVIIIRTHTTLYPSDPFYEYNTTDNGARQVYYNSANANPRAFLLGTFMGNYNATNWTSALNTQLAASRIMGVSVNNTYDTVAKTGTLNIAMTQSGTISATDLVYHVALTESDLHYNAPNGEDIFEQVLRDLVTGPNGEPISITSGQTLNIVKNYSVGSVVNDRNANLIVYAQSTSTKQVYGVEMIKVRR